MSEVDELIAKWGRDQEVLIEIMHDIQSRHNYLPPELLDEVAEKLGTPKSIVYSVATFYNAFSIEPRGEHLIEVCTGTSCHVKGAPGVLGAIERHARCQEGKTDPTGTFTLLTTRCVGACGLAPVMVIDNETFGNVTQVTVPRILKKFQNAQRAEETVGAATAEARP